MNTLHMTTNDVIVDKTGRGVADIRAHTLRSQCERGVTPWSAITRVTRASPSNFTSDRCDEEPYCMMMSNAPTSRRPRGAA